MEDPCRRLQKSLYLKYSTGLDKSSDFNRSLVICPVCIKSFRFASMYPHIYSNLHKKNLNRFIKRNKRA